MVTSHRYMAFLEHLHIKIINFFTYSKITNFT